MKNCRDLLHSVYEIKHTAIYVFLLCLTKPLSAKEPSGYILANQKQISQSSILNEKVDILIKKTMNKRSL